LEHTFHAELEEAIRTEIDRLGSFIMVSALRRADGLAYGQGRQKSQETGEVNLAEGIVMSAENGRSWLIPHKENDKIVITEYRLPLSDKQQVALIDLKKQSSGCYQSLAL